MMSLAEESRPLHWEQVVGQDSAIATLNLMRRRSKTLAGRAYWLSGSSGTGKTTIAKLIANEVADDWAIDEIDAQTLTAGQVQDLERRVQTMALGERRGHAIILNEAHGLSSKTIRHLLSRLEKSPRHVVWVFTTTSEGQEGLFADEPDSAPLLSRCTVIALSRRGLAEPFALQAKEIAERNGLGGAELPKYVRLAKDCRNNFRAMLQAIESGAMLVEQPAKVALEVVADAAA